jgi:phenylpropionate dioxygenase-like ring-hydroxylating dioxygenase large terminal subunit
MRKILPLPKLGRRSALALILMIPAGCAQIVCHDSDIAEPGEWRSLEYLGESVIVIRGDDGEARAFANVCRHRGSRLVDGEAAAPRC